MSVKEYKRNRVLPLIKGELEGVLTSAEVLLTPNPSQEGNRTPPSPWVGLSWGIVIIIGWFLSLQTLFWINFETFNALEILGLILGRTMLQTGLFVIAHDAIHGSLFPPNPRLNRELGIITLWFYAGLSYARCCHNHHQHHANPGQEIDPDFWGNDRFEARFLQRLGNSVVWYCKFIGNYLSLQQLISLGLISTLWIIFMPLSVRVYDFILSSHLTDYFIWSSVQLKAIVLFYILPLILSSFQLFLFGTYLPHQVNPKLEMLTHHSYSLDYPEWLSFLTCYHFGYHWEHHEYPHLPWYKLPQVHLRLRSQSVTASSQMCLGAVKSFPD